MTTSIDIEHSSHNPANNRSIRLYLGGSFDPPHVAHMAMLQHVYQTLHANTASHAHHQANKADKTDSVLSATNADSSITPLFLPTARSPLKQKSTAAKHRLAMLQLACAALNLNQPSLLKKDNYQVSEFEIWQTPPTYTINTLKALRQQHPNASLVFIVGADSVASLDRWRLGDQLTKFAHLWIMPRGDLQTASDLYPLLPTPMQAQITPDLSDLCQKAKGCIYIDVKKIAPISSSQIRAAIADKNHDFLQSFLLHSVYSYIIANKLYQ